MTTSEVATMAKSPRGTEFNVVFTDGNKVSYFEKLLMRKYKDGTISMQPNIPQPVPTKIESDEELGRVPVISKYNVFYDADDMDGDVYVGTTANGVPVSSVNCEEDFPTMANKPRPSSICIEELTSNDDVWSLPEPKIVLPLYGKEVVQEGDSNSSKKVAEAKGIRMATEVATVKSSKSGKHKDGERIGRRKKREKEQLSAPLPSNNEKEGEFDQQSSETKETEPSLQSSSHGHDPQLLKQSDIFVSVRSAWDSCTQSQHNSYQLGHFFLHGVQPVNDEEEMTSPKPPTLNDPKPHFKLGSTVWLPGSSTTQQEPELELPSISEGDEPPSSRPSTRDWYYNDSDSDSEPENEREEFIQSRMGMAHDPMNCRPATSTSSKDLEMEDRMERDKDDCEALDELAWELASTVEYEGRLTRCERDLDASEDGEHEQDMGTPIPMVEGGDEVGVANKQVMDMSEVISEFELYQQKLMEEDSDEEQ